MEEKVEDYTQTDAWRQGVERAEEQLALQPPPDATASVSLLRSPDRIYYKLCQKCGWARDSDKCECGGQLE